MIFQWKKLFEPLILERGQSYYRSGRVVELEEMEILNNPSHPEYLEFTAWVRGTWWQPLNVEEINRRIKNVCSRRGFPSVIGSGY